MRVLRLEPTRRCKEKRARGSPYATAALAVSRPATRGAFTRLVGRVRLAIVPGAARRKTRRGSLYSNLDHRPFFTARATKDGPCTFVQEMRLRARAPITSQKQGGASDRESDEIRMSRMAACWMDNMRWMDTMRICSVALLLSAHLIWAVAAKAEDIETSHQTTAGSESESSSSNAANNPVEPLLTLQYWNYYAPSLNNVSGNAENGEAKAIIPFTIAGVQQIMHIIPSLVTNPTAASGPRTGLGDTQIYNFTLGHFDVGLPQKVTLGLGPLVAIPTSANRDFGTDALQAGAAGIILAPQSWGLLGVLATYQQTLSGVSSHVTVAQPLIFFNLSHGYYLRSSAAMTFNTANHTSVVPVGLGPGKVIQLDGGYTLNIYAEVQPSLYRTGLGAPNYQIFTGIQLQFPASFTNGWNLF
jgi:hypothetical protein